MGYRWPPTYDCSTYDFSALQCFKSDTHVVETVLWIFIFDFFPQANNICRTILPCVGGQWQWAADYSQPYDHEDKHLILYSVVVNSFSTYGGLSVYNPIISQEVSVHWNWDSWWYARINVLFVSSVWDPLFLDLTSDLFFFFFFLFKSQISAQISPSNIGLP